MSSLIPSQKKFKASHAPIKDKETEHVLWHGKTYKLPVRLASGVEDRYECERYLENTLRAINSNETVPFSQRLMLLDDRFDFPQLINEVNGMIVDIHDFMRPTGDGPIILTNESEVFTLSEPSLFSDKGKVVKLPRAGKPLPAEIRTKARYYAFKLEVDAMKAVNKTNPDMAKKLDLKVITFPVAVALPTQMIEDDDSVEAADDDAVAVLSVFLPLLHKPKELLQILKAQLNREPTYGYTTKQAARAYMTLDEKTFSNDFKEHVHWCRFQIYHQLLRQEFLPSTPFDAGAIIRAIHECKQSYWDTERRQFVHLSVKEFGERFASRLNSWPPDMPYPDDFPVVFWQNLDKSIHDEAATMIPTPYIPPPRKSGERNHQADERLRLIKQTAISLERRMKNITTQVQQLTRFSRNNTARTFVSYPDEQMALQDPMSMVTCSSDFQDALQCLGMDPVATGWNVDETYGSEYESNQATVAYGHTLTTVPKVMEINRACDILCAQALVMVSTAEQAIARARGINSNRGPCWGCDGLAGYQADSYNHLWSECPHKGISEVRANAQRNMKQFLSSRNSIQDKKPAAVPKTSTVPAFHTTLTERLDQLKTTWEQEGHPSFDKVSLLASILDPTTNKKARQACYQALARSSAKRSTVENESGSTAARSNKSTNPDLPMLFVGIPFPNGLQTSVLQAGVVPPPTMVPLSQIMPHAAVAIGSRGMASLVAMIDSGSGCSIGRLSYHKSIADNVPELVAKFEWIEEQSQIGIGGVDSQGTPIKITAVIVYHTPYRCEGQPVQLTFGLSTHVSANTILGIPFLRQAHAAIMMNTDNGKESLVCSRFGQVFPLLYQPPHLADEAPKSGLSTAGGTFQASPLVHVKMDQATSRKIIHAVSQVVYSVKSYFQTQVHRTPVMIGWQDGTSKKTPPPSNTMDLCDIYDNMEHQTILDEQLEEWAE